MDFSTEARWIWQQGEASPRNLWLRLRRAFRSAQNVQRATLLVSADSRYEIFINGKWLGTGPVRSFPWYYSYDQYDITSLLKSDQGNIVAARVVHWGDHTFQYIRGRGGFLCEIVLELANGQTEHIVSDENWQISPDAAFIRNTPRISIQQPFEEQYDARREEDGWMLSGSLTDGWEAPQVIGPVGTAPWNTLAPRRIPFLTRDPVMPTRVLAAELAQPLPGYRWCFDLRHRYAPPSTGLRAEPIGERGRAFATEIIAPQACTITIYAEADYDTKYMFCNGQRLTHLPTTVDLHPGRNLFMLTGSEWPSLLFSTTESLTFDASSIVPDAPADCVWAYIGPFDERDEALIKQLATTDPASWPPVPRLAISVSENMVDIQQLTSTQRFLLPSNGFCDITIDRPQPRQRIEGERLPLVENVVNLLHQNAQYTTLYPQPDSDVHLVIDFDRELIGYPVLELDASEGTIVDINFFEGIDDSGIFWTDLLRNSLRYVCREGHQTFHSHQRRGFRYASLTVREASRPIKLYNLHSLLSTYPVEQRGRFACSDPLLTNIWAVGAYTVQLCMEDTYTDCPAYEQTFWVGDARNSALVNAVAFGAYDLTDRCLRLTGQSLSRQLDIIKPPHLRDLPHLTTDHVGSGWFSQIPMWTFLWIWNVWEHYQITSDKASLAALYPDVRECLQRCLGYLTERDLLDFPDLWNLVDWAAMDLTRDGEVTSSNALLVESLRQGALMAEELATITPADSASLTADATAYREVAERVYAAINRYCWSEERGAYVDTVRDEEAYQRHIARRKQPHQETLQEFVQRTRISEPTNTLVLQCHCAPPERAERILPLVMNALDGKFVGSSPDRAKSWPADQVVPVGSPWFLFFTLETMLAQGKVHEVLTLIREQWGKMLEKGATTFWETFPGYRENHWSRSLCHGWSAAPAYFLSTQILGIQPAAPGYARVQIAPHRFTLDWAEGTVPTPHGDVYVCWTRTEQGLEVETSLPAGVSGELIGEDPTDQPQYLSGTQGAAQQEQKSYHVLLSEGSHSRYLLPLHTA
jgi:alpha-L-rhamnosidase